MAQQVDFVYPQHYNSVIRYCLRGFGIIIPCRFRPGENALNRAPVHAALQQRWRREQERRGRWFPREDGAEEPPPPGATYVGATSIQERLMNIVELDFNSRSKATMSQWDDPENIDPELMWSRCTSIAADGEHYVRYLQRIRDRRERAAAASDTSQRPTKVPEVGVYISTDLDDILCPVGTFVNLPAEVVGLRGEAFEQAERAWEEAGWRRVHDLGRRRVHDLGTELDRFLNQTFGVEELLEAEGDPHGGDLPDPGDDLPGNNLPDAGDPPGNNLPDEGDLPGNNPDPDEGPVADVGDSPDIFGDVRDALEWKDILARFDRKKAQRCLLYDGWRELAVYLEESGQPGRLAVPRQLQHRLCFQNRSGGEDGFHRRDPQELLASDDFFMREHSINFDNSFRWDQLGLQEVGVDE